MTQEQIGTLINVVLLLAALFTGGSVVLTGGLLFAVVSLVRAVRNDKALEAAIEKLYQSVPAPVQQVIKEAGDALAEAGGLIGDVTAAPGTTTTTTASVTTSPNAGG